MKQKIKVVQEVASEKLDQIIHAAYLMGYMARVENYSLTHIHVIQEIKNLKRLVREDINL